ncbi:MAG TPA: WecB/TagA/CpsF family glycosyltransferase [Ignavibacteriaceae bacterium]|nr:WecB/TagA/CpsF family glycosyltransferase [Ignavibacteriaceae bacterium]
MIINNLLLTQEKVFAEILESLEKDKWLLLTYLNQNSFNIYSRNKNYKEILDTQFKVYQADIGVYLLLKYLKVKNISRLDATKLNTNILDQLIKKNIPISFIGGDFSEDFIREECVKRNINIAGYHSGFFNSTKTKEVINIVKEYKSQVYFIGMGVPKQEMFAYELSKNSENKLIICVGNFFEFYFGTIKRAPVFFQKIGAEWLFRLITEPKRLWKRYLLGIPEFIYRGIKIKSGKMN